MDVHAEGPAGGSEVTLTAVKSGYTQGNMATLGKNATGMAEMQGYLRVKYANDVKAVSYTHLIAEAHGISRQGVHEMVKRCDRILEEMESKLHLMEKNQKLRELAELILRRSEAADSPEKALEEVRQWASLLLEEL